MECISWNNEAGRFEFQVVDDYLPGKEPKVRYVNRSTCLACHQHGAPIFPQRSWLESDDSLSLEMGLIFANYAGKWSDLEARKDEVMTAVNNRIRTSREDRQRPRDPDIERFRAIRAGKLDSAVAQSALIMNVDKLWVHLCGFGQAGNSCRRQIFKAYLALSFASDSADERAAIGREMVEKVEISKYQRNWDRVRVAESRGSFFMDRDPLTAVFDVETELRECNNSNCTFDLIKKMITPAATEAMIRQGQAPNALLNPRLTRPQPMLPPEFTFHDALFTLANNMSLFFYRGQINFDDRVHLMSDFGTWVRALGKSDFAKIDSETDPKKKNAMMVEASKIGYQELLKKAEMLDDRYFDPVPISRERFLFGYWDGLNEQRALGFYRMLTRPMPEKDAEEVAKVFVADEKKDPALNIITTVCVMCHGVGPGFSNIPQFAYAGDRSDLISNVFYHRDNMIKQLEALNMPPPYEYFPNFNEDTRKMLIHYLKTMDPSGAEKQ